MFLGGLFAGLVAGACLMLLWFFRNDVARRRRIQRVKDNWGMNTLDRPDEVEKLLGRVPKRLQFPEFEEVDWLNTQLVELWPYINKATKAMMQEVVEPLLDLYKPPMVKTMEFERITLGSRPPQVDGVRVSQSDEGQVVLDLNVSWQGSGKIILNIKTNAKIKLQAQVSSMSFSGQLRVMLDMTDKIPCIAAAVVTLFRKPDPPHYHLSYDLKGLGCNLDTIPGLTTMIYKTITAALEDSLLWPNRIVTPIAPDYDTKHLEFMYQGEVVVTVVGAEKLKNKDLFGKSDARAVIWVRATHKASTRVIDGSLHPMWDETFVLPVDDPNTSEVYVEVQDKDSMGWDSMGYASFELAELLNAKKEKEFKVQLVASHSLEENIGEGKLGTITLKAIYRPYGDEEKEIVTQAEKNRKGKKKSRSLSPEAAEEAKARALHGEEGRTDHSHAKKGLGHGVEKSQELETELPVDKEGEVGAPVTPTKGEGAAGLAFRAAQARDGAAKANADTSDEEDDEKENGEAGGVDESPRGTDSEKGKYGHEKKGKVGGMVKGLGHKIKHLGA